VFFSLFFIFVFFLLVCMFFVFLFYCFCCLRGCIRKMPPQNHTPPSTTHTMTPHCDLPPPQGVGNKNWLSPHHYAFSHPLPLCSKATHPAKPPLVFFFGAGLVFLHPHQPRGFFLVNRCSSTPGWVGWDFGRGGASTTHSQKVVSFTSVQGGTFGGWFVRGGGCGGPSGTQNSSRKTGVNKIPKQLLCKHTNKPNTKNNTNPKTNQVWIYGFFGVLGPFFADGELGVV